MPTEGMLQVTANSAMRRLIKDDMPFFTPRKIQRGQDVIELLTPIIREKGYIAGSYAAWAVTSKENWQPGDIDVFCVSSEAQNQLYAALKQIGYQCASWGEVVCNMTPDYHCPIRRDIQLIKPNPAWKNFIHDLMKSFDLDISRAVLLNTEWGIADRNVGRLEGIILTINSPLRVLKRLMKYHARGVTFEESEILKLFKAWDAMTAEQKQTAIAAFLPVPDDDTSDYYNSAFDDDHFFTE